MFAVLSDVHSNIEALTAVMREIKKRKIKKVYCCGDVVGYNTNPNECVELLKKEKVKCIKGNHEIGFLNSDFSHFNPWAAAAIKWQQNVLSEENKKFISKLDDSIRENSFALFHGSPRSAWDYVYPPTPDLVLEQYLNEAGKDIMVIGHTHFPFIKEVGKMLFVNAGSVGQPRDGDSRACFVIISEDDMTAEIVRVKYDFKVTAGKITKAGLPATLAERLYEGW